MRIRGTKPEFWRSRTVSLVSWEARLVLKGLESYVDDNGVGKDDLALIVGDVFPRDMLANPRETLARVSEAISDLHQAGLVWRYEADGRALLYISNWESIQRIDKPGKGRFPRPDGTMDFRSSVIRESVASPPVTLAPVTGEQGNRGTGEQGQELLRSPAAPTSKRATPSRFDEFWSVYPRKVGKDRAVKAYAAAIKRAGEQAVIDGATRYAQDPNLPEMQFVPHPTKWLTDGRWQDGPLPERRDTPRSSDRQGDVLRAEMERARIADAANENRLEIEA